MARKAAKTRRPAKRSAASALRRDAISRMTLAAAVQTQIDRFGLSRNAAAVVVRDAPSQVSRLMTGHAEEFSADRLVAWLLRLGSDVTVTIHQGRRLGKRGKVRIQID